LPVDDHARPIDELERILSLHRLYFERTEPSDVLPLEREVLTEVRDLLRAAGYRPGVGPAYDRTTYEALKAYYLTENFDERWSEQAVIDRKVLQYMRDTLGR
jgi:uncharacterized Ntn-hydrolase superfamily protein